MTHLVFYSNPWILPIVMIVILAIALEVPALLGKAFIEQTKIADGAWTVVQTGVVGLVAFMLGLSYSQSQARYDARRALVMTEANAIGTTWLRADQLPAGDAARFRAILRNYTATRLHAYQSPLASELHARAQAASDADQARLWSIASSGLRASPENLGRSLLMQALNDTIDVSGEELNALTHHVPTTILVLTFGLVALGAVLIGFGFARSGANPRVLAAAYILSTVLVMDMIVDLDRPQTGFVHVNLDPLVVQLRSMR